MNATEQLLEQIAALKVDPLPQAIRAKAKLALLDYLGVTVAGAHTFQDKTDRLRSLAMDKGGSTHPIGCGASESMDNAIFLNGLNAHALDFDDGTNTGIIHLGSPVFSALLPLAQQRGITGERMLQSAVVGYETSFTLAVSIQPKHKALGYHATGTCGTVGVAVAIAHMLGFTREEMKNAIACAAVSASGTLKALDDNSELKPYNAAKAALMGYLSAFMALAGFQGADDPLDGERGFLTMMSGDAATQLQPMQLNGTFAIEKSYIKPYAACRYCHPAIEAAVAIAKEEHLTLADIRRVDVSTYRLAVFKHDHRCADSVASAKMSIPYSVAAGMVLGHAGFDAYREEAVSNQQIVSLAEKVFVHEDELFSSQFPQLTPAETIVTMQNGTVYRRKVNLPKGEPENPLTEGEVREKFAQLAHYAGWADERIAKACELVAHFESSLPALSALLSE